MTGGRYGGTKIQTTNAGSNRVRSLAGVAFPLGIGSADKVLEKYPALTREDLAAVEGYVLGSIRSRTRDEITGRPTLPKNFLRDGGYYKGRCRNATVARWNEAEQQFYHWCEKSGNIYIKRLSTRLMRRSHGGTSSSSWRSWKRRNSKFHLIMPPVFREIRPILTGFKPKCGLAVVKTEKT